MKSYQLDVKSVSNKVVVCNMYTGLRCVRVLMHENDYRSLIRDKFFIRPNEEEDSAGVINTTEVYFTKPSPKE